MKLELKTSNGSWLVRAPMSTVLQNSI